MAWRILFSFNVCSTCLSFTTCTATRRYVKVNPDGRHGYIGFAKQIMAFGRRVGMRALKVISRSLNQFAYSSE